MEEKKAIQDDQLDTVSGGKRADEPKSEKKNMIRSLYDSGTEIEIGIEKESVKIYEAVQNLIHPNK